MKNLRSFLAFGIAAILMGLSLAVPPEMVPQDQPQFEFTWKPYQEIERDLVDKIGQQNSELLKLFAQLQKISTEQVSVLAEQATKTFSSTYLARPALTYEGQRYEDWRRIIPILKGLMDQGQQIEIQTVQVRLGYIPFAEAENPELDIDMRADISTLLALSSNGQNGALLECFLCHRRVCIWSACPIY